MVDNTTDFGQEAYGQFYLPLTDKLRECGIDAINPQQHGFSGRWRIFHTGSVHFPHDSNAHRIRALFHRPAGSGRPAPGAPGARRRLGSHLHPITAPPAPPAPDPALAAVRAGDTLVVPKLDRLARSVPDARVIADLLRERGVKLALGRALYDPGDPMGKLFFNILATFAELCSVSRPTVYRTLNRPLSP